jgi:hypothetical protein
MSEFLIALITVMVYLAVVCTWFFALFDLFFRDMSGIAKVLWLLAILFVPFLGVLAYFVTRPRKPFSELYFKPSESGIYSQKDETAAQQAETLARLRNQGAISDDEYVRLRGKSLA